MLGDVWRWNVAWSVLMLLVVITLVVWRCVLNYGKVLASKWVKVAEEKAKFNILI